MTPPQRLRILMTADAVGGVWTYAVTLGGELARRGHRVRLVTMGPPPREDQLSGVPLATNCKVLVTDLALEWMDPEGRDAEQAVRTLQRIERHVEPDIVHLNGYREARAEWRAPVVVVAHSCVRSWWHACRGEEPADPQWACYAAGVRDGLNAAESWLAPTAALRDTLVKLYAPVRKGRVIWNGIDTQASPVPGRKEPFILAAGRLWDEAKNVATLARAAPGVAWPIRIAGPLSRGTTWPGSWPQNLVALGGLPRERLHEVMSRASIFAAPAVYEPFGLAALEAAARGCALVLSDIPSFRELWDGAALFVAPRDTAAWRSMLVRLSQDEGLRRTMQVRARERAARYDLGRMVDAYESLYADLVGRPQPTRHPSAQLAESLA